MELWKKRSIGEHSSVAKSDRLCEVVVFPLRVTLEAVTWREQTQRMLAWFSRDEAAALVDEGGLALIIDGWR
jgi:hypothetical protein